MIGILTALPGTQLERRLSREGRLIDRASGETFGRPNFKTRVTESVLLEIYGKALARIYEPKEYFERCLRALRLRPSSNASMRLPLRYALACLLRSIWRQGLTGSYRKDYWRFFAQVLRHAPRRIARAVALAVAGEHMIGYTQQAVLPRIEEATLQARGEEAAQLVDMPPANHIPRSAHPARVHDGDSLAAG